MIPNNSLANNRRSRYGAWLAGSLLAGCWLAAMLGNGAALASDAAWDPRLSQAIDAQIDARLQQLGRAAVGRATEVELARRLHLDILGRIPTADEVTAFLADDRPDKVHRRIDELLAHEEMPIYWRIVVDEWLNGAVREREFGRQGYLDYLEESLRENKRWDRLAREMIAPELTDPAQRRAAYFLAVRARGSDAEARLDGMATGVASGFFGLQLQCAKCHDHPFVDDLRQEHYYGLAAFFGRTQEARLNDTPIVKERAEGEVTFVSTEREKLTARLLFLDGHVIDEPPPPEDKQKWYAPGEQGLPETPYFSRRQALAEYALGGDQPAFRRAIVNRMWKQLVGRGLVEPVDQMHAANPPSHPALLDLLSDDFALHGFDLRRLMAGILHSETYLRSSRWESADAQPAEWLYATAILKPLTPDQLSHSLALATGQLRTLAARFEREKQKHQLDVVNLAVTRRLAERERDFQTLAARFRNEGESFEANASQALFFTYNSIVRNQLRATPGSLVDELARLSDNAEAAQRAYLAILSRPAAAAEIAAVAAYLDRAAPAREELVREVVWALAASAEFRFNY